ncbi:MAG: HlyD family efflux transporter periplasmic adaptor subunit [Bacteroidetes bacterium]|nr:HlyD family efflux transporter periplasmic adaptor subunit [Bacteroidota bacterium]
MRLKKKTRLSLLAAGLIILCGSAAIFALSHREEPLLRTGSIEAREIDIASKIPGRLRRIPVREGQRVHAGDMLFELSDREMKAKVAQAQGAVDAARAQWDMARNGTRPEQIEMADRGYRAAQSQFELAENTFRRMTALHADSLLSEQEFDGVRQKYNAARAAMDAAAAQLRMAEKGARSEEKAMARGQFDRASQTLVEAESYFEETSGRAPIDGIVSKRYADSGELVSTGYPVLTIMDPKDMWAELNLPETELRRVHVGDVLPGTVNGTGKRLSFRVENIAAMADFANWRAQNDRGSYEVRSFCITLRPTRQTKNMRPGMTVVFELPSE